MIRYLKLLGYFARFSFTRATEFRIDFTFRIFMDVVYYIVHILFFKILYLHTPLLAGWSEPKGIMFVATLLLLDAISMTLFSNNFWYFPVSVNRGDLDYYLTRPISTLFFMCFRDLALNSFVNLLMAIGILVWAIQNYPEPVTSLHVVCYLGLLALGVYLSNLLRLLFLIPVLWTQSGRGFDPLFFAMTRLSERPDGLLKGWFRSVFTMILPFAIVASYPTRYFVGDLASLQFIQFVVVTLAMSGVVLWVWKLGLRSYSSASS